LYRKFTADRVFDGNRFLPTDQVIITSDEGKISAVTTVAEAGDGIQHLPGILTPGFINCHCHLELSHMQGAIPEKTGLVSFVQQVMSRRGEAAAQKEQAMQKAEQEMYNNGIVAVGDICNTADAIGIKRHSKLYWNNFIEVSGFVDSAAEKRAADAEIILTAHHTALPAQYAVVVPHAPYSVSKTLFQLLNNKTAGKLITIHNQESAEEDKLYQNRSGDFLNLYKNFGIDIASFKPTRKSSLQSWRPYFTNDQSVISVHNTFTGNDDIHFLQTKITGQKTFFCLCPAANLYIEDMLPDVALLQKSGYPVVLGTDSYASNHQLSIWHEIKILQKHFPQLSLDTLLQWATINGAKAMQLEHILGSFEKGKQPGLVLIKDEETVSRIL